MERLPERSAVPEDTGWHGTCDRWAQDLAHGKSRSKGPGPLSIVASPWDPSQSETSPLTLEGQVWTNAVLLPS